MKIVSMGGTLQDQTYFEDLNKVSCAVYVSEDSNHWMFNGYSIYEQATSKCVEHLKSIGIEVDKGDGPSMGAGGPGTLWEYVTSLDTWTNALSLVSVLKGMTAFISSSVDKRNAESGPSLVISLTLRTRDSADRVNLRQVRTNMSTCMFLHSQLRRVLNSEFPGFAIAESSGLVVNGDWLFGTFMGSRRSNSFNRYRLLRQIRAMKVDSSRRLEYSAGKFGTIRRLETTVSDPDDSDYHFRQRLAYTYWSTRLLRDYFRQK